MAEFHETGYGKRFFEGQLPSLIKALEQIANVMTHPPEPRIVPLATQLVHVTHDAPKPSRDLARRVNDYLERLSTEANPRIAGEARVLFEECLGDD